MSANSAADELTPARTDAHVVVYRYPSEKLHERWSFAHVSRNGWRQISRKAYVTKWNAKRAARRLYPGLPVVDEAE